MTVELFVYVMIKICREMTGLRRDLADMDYPSVWFMSNEDVIALARRKNLI